MLHNASMLTEIVQSQADLGSKFHTPCMLPHQRWTVDEVSARKNSNRTATSLPPKVYRRLLEVFVKVSREGLRANNGLLAVVDQVVGSNIAHEEKGGLR